MKTIKKICICLLVFVIWLSGCNMPAAGTSVASSPTPAGIHVQEAGQPKAWIDAPLNGMVLPDAPYEIVYHAADLKGVKEVSLTINGVKEEIGESPVIEDNLLTQRHVWDPAGPGTYTLQVRAKDGDNKESDVSEVKVIVLGGTITATPTVTATATPTATVTPTPKPNASLELIEMFRSSDSFFTGSCSPNTITLVVRATDPSKVMYMHLFYRFQNTRSGEATAYESIAMKKSGDATWTITLRYDQLKNYEAYKESWFIYQFVSQGPNKEITRGPSKANVKFSRCESSGAPEQVITNTPPPIITLPLE